MTTKHKDVSLTDAERTALKAAFQSAAGNGHDFGFIEDIVKSLRPMKAQAVGALVTSLVKKDVLTVYEPVRTGSGLFTQFTWNYDVITFDGLKALVAGECVEVQS